jgi:diguanylate cyclase (GGDEF)-like protein/PAS domain S-box-containing protein
LLEVLDDQKRALQQSEQQYRVVTEFSTHLAFLRAPNGQMRYVVPNCLDLTGYPDSDFYEDPGLLDRIVHPEDRPLWLAHWEEVRTGTKARHGPLEFRLLRRDGALRWISHTCQPVVDQAGTLLGLRGSHADITERKRAEQALLESEARLAEAIRIARLGSWRLDLQSGDFTVSPEHLNMMGYEGEAPPQGLVLPLSEYIRTYIHPEDDAPMAERYRFAAEHGGDPGYRDTFEYRLIHGDGSMRSVSVTAHALPGRPGVIHGVTQDITERKEAERALAELSRWHEQILNSAGEGILGLSREGRHVFANPAAAHMLGFERGAEIIGQKSHPLWHHTHSDGRPFPVEECPILDSLHDGKVRQVDDEVFWRKDGSSFPAAYTSTPMFEGERIVGAVVVFEDITERKRAEEALRESQTRLRAVIENEPECVKLLDRDGRVLEMNPAGLAMLEADTSQVVGRPLSDLVLPEYRAAFEALTARVFQSESGMLEFEAEGLGGRRLWLETHAVPLRGAQGEILALLAVTRDITERKRIEEKLEHDALHDGLTGLPNRVLFMDRLNQCLERTKRKQDYTFAVLFLDLDRFKVVNDSLGHLVGDQLLVDIARRLERCVRPVDTVARLGGDEFGLLLDDTADPSDATRVVERIERALAKPFRHEGQEVFSSASIGIAVSSMGYQRPEDLMRDADTAMYRAKFGGKSRFQVFDAAMHQRAMQTLRMETDLRYALDREELRVYYQPILGIRSGRIACFEALLRWQHAEKGLLLPAEFIPIAEETELILPVGAWVLRTACKHLRGWQAQFPQHHHLAVAVNLSTRQFLQADLGSTIRNSLEETGLPGRYLKIEVTETMIMENVEVAAGVLLDLKALGVHVCMDDFGTGYSSLSRLHGLPIDSLKVDKSFVGRMHSDGKNLELVRTIVGLAHNLGMHVIAEGVETREQLDLLRNLDCEYAQGYVLAEPLPAEGVGALLAEAAGENGALLEPTRG